MPPSPKPKGGNNMKVFTAHFRTRMNGKFLDDIYKDITATSYAEAVRFAKSIIGQLGTEWLIKVYKVEVK